MAKTPFSSRRAATFWASTASPSMMGTMGCSPSLRSKPRAFMAALKYLVLACSRSRSSLEAEMISRALREALTMLGARVLENRYGRDRWRSSSTISRRPLV